MSWPLVKLDEIFDVARGGSPRPIQDYITDDSDGINWVMISDATDSSKYITKTKKKIKPSGLKKSRMVQPGDFLLTNSMSFGRPYIMNTTGCIHDGWLVLSPKSENIDTSYFYHLFGSNAVYRHFSSVAAGAVVKNLNIDLVKALEIPLPPLPEQKRIAAILDKADSLRRKNQQAIQLADQFLRAVFLDLFGDPVTNPKGWPVEKVGAITDCIVPGRDKPKSFTGDIPWVTTNDVIHLGVTHEPNEFVGLTANEIKEAKSKVVPKDSILMTCVGDLGVLSIAGRDIVINQQLHAFLPSSKINNVFLMYALSFQKNYMLQMASNTTVPYMNKTICNSVPLILPEIKLQSNFSEIFEKVKNNLKKLKVGDVNSKFLFDSLSQKAFSGDL